MILIVPKYVVNELEKIQKDFLWKNYSPKIKHETFCNEYKGGGLKNIDILNKIISGGLKNIDILNKTTSGGLKNIDILNKIISLQCS